MRAGMVVAALAGTVFLAPVVPRPVLADWPAFGRALIRAPGSQLGPTVAADGAAGAIVAWLDRGTPAPFNIKAQHVRASGELDPAWPTNGRALLTDLLAQSIVPTGNEAPRIVSDGAGGAIVTWADARIAANGLDVQAHHRLASGAVDPAWPVNGTTVSPVTGDQLSPFIISDGAGGEFIGWVDSRSGATVGDLDVYAQHLLASGRVDPGWPAGGVPVSTAPKAQNSIVLVRDGAGGVIAAWSDFRSGNPGTDIYAQHLSSSGAVDPAWPVNGSAVSAAPGSQFGPSMISDNGSEAVIAWTDTRDGTNEIFAQRILKSGAIASCWPVNGRAISIGGTDEVLPTLVSDGAGGAIVAWGGGSSGHHNMRAQHVLATSALDAAWPVGGKALSFANSEETSQVMVSDGAGGAIVAWQRSFDIFAQHVLVSGALDATYPAGGLPVCVLGPSLQHEPDMVAAGPGGAIVAWMDTRDDASDIYALQVLATGTVGVPAPTVPGEIALARPSPNPARGPVTLRFALPREAPVRLGIYDVSGRQVRELASGRQTAGEHVLDWDLRDEFGHAVGAGLYFARLELEGRVLTHRVARL